MDKSESYTSKMALDSRTPISIPYPYTGLLQWYSVRWPCLPLLLFNLLLSVK